MDRAGGIQKRCAKPRLNSTLKIWKKQQTENKKTGNAMLPVTKVGCV